MGDFSMGDFYMGDFYMGDFYMGDFFQLEGDHVGTADNFPFLLLTFIFVWRGTT